MNDVLLKTVDFVKSHLADAEKGHDWWHIHRVWQQTKKLLQSEHADSLVCELAALLHDIADSKFHNGDEEIGPKTAEDFLLTLPAVSEEQRTHIVSIIRNISFRNSFGQKKFHSKELGIVQDADRLDAIGAIGIARAFHFGGFKNRELYDPNMPPAAELTKETYTAGKGSTINHFHEKLLHLKDQMNTPTAKRMAEERHKFMLDFLTQFDAEWKGEA